MLPSIFDAFRTVTGCSYPWWLKFIVVSQIISNSTLTENLLHKRGVYVLLSFENFNHKSLQVLCVNTNCVIFF